jgi:signal peptidase II
MSAVQIKDSTSRRTEIGSGLVPMWQHYGLLAVVALLVFCADQITKAIVTRTLAHGNVVVILGGAAQLEYARNTGAAFSLFRAGGALFAVIAIVVSAGILVYYRRTSGSPFLVRLALGGILGGALGNLVDRVRLGYVVDFIDFRWWPVFNVADSCIVVGVVLLVLHSLVTDQKIPT